MINQIKEGDKDPERRMANKQLRILITGGAGSIGSEIVKQLLASLSFSVICIYSRDELKHLTLYSKLKQYENRLRFFIGDVRDYERLQFACSECDYVIHLAAMKHVELCNYNPFECIQTNVNGTLNLVKACNEARNVKKLLFISTDKVVQNRSIYAVTKLLGEKIILTSKQWTRSNLAKLIIRIGNVIDSEGSILKRIKSGEKITVKNSSCTRFYLWKKDVAKFIIDQLFSNNKDVVVIPFMKAFLLSDLLDLTHANFEEVYNLPYEDALHELLFSEQELYCIKKMKEYYLIDYSKVNRVKCEEIIPSSFFHIVRKNELANELLLHDFV